MGQTMETLPRAKKVYKIFFRSKKIDVVIKKLISWLVDMYAKRQNFRFPAKFDWDWKLEMLTKKYEIETVHLFKNIIKQGMTVVDIGAHIGFFTRLFSDLVGSSGRVIAFEADQENFDLLKHNTKHLDNVKIYCNAISDRDGIINFYKTINHTGCHSVVPSDFRPLKTTVLGKTLDSFFVGNLFNRVDVVKMDIEGGETRAIRGMQKILKNNDDIKLIVEFHPTILKDAGFDPLKFVQSFEEMGFSVRTIEKNGLKIVTKHVVDMLEKKEDSCRNLFIYKNKKT